MSDKDTSEVIPHVGIWKVKEGLVRAHLAIVESPDGMVTHSVSLGFGKTEEEAAMGAYKLGKQRLEALERLLKEKGLWRED